MRWEQVVEFAAKTDVGMRRQNNEDTCGAHLAREEKVFRERGHLFVVADGMGGHAVGELASKLAADTSSPFVSQVDRRERPKGNAVCGRSSKHCHQLAGKPEP